MRAVTGGEIKLEITIHWTCGIVATPREVHWRVFLPHRAQSLSPTRRMWQRDGCGTGQRFSLEKTQAFSPYIHSHAWK